MADRYWVGNGGSTAWSQAGNWSATSGGPGGASPPAQGDRALFNSLASGPCTLDIDIRVGALVMSGYTGSFSAGSRQVAIDGNATLSGIVNLGSANWTIAGGTLHYGAVAALNRETSTIVLQGASAIVGVGGKYLGAVVVAAGSTVTVASNVGSLASIAVAEGGTLRIDTPGIVVLAGWLSLAAGAHLTGSGTMQIISVTQATEGITSLAATAVIDVATLLLTHWSAAARLAPGSYGCGLLKIQSVGAVASCVRLAAGSYALLGDLEIECSHAAGSATLDGATNGAALSVEGDALIDRQAGSCAWTGAVTLAGAADQLYQMTAAAVQPRLSVSKAAGNVSLVAVATRLCQCQTGGGLTLVSGTLDASVDNPPLRFGGHANISGGLFLKSSGPLVLNGTAAQTVGDMSTGAIQVANSGGAVTFSHGIAGAASLEVCSGGSLDPAGKALVVAGMCRVAPGGQIVTAGLGNSQWTLGSLDWRGTAAAPLNLAAASPWTVAVAGKAVVRHAAVGRGNASAGLPIDADGCVDAGGNAHWVFHLIADLGPAAAGQFWAGARAAGQHAAGAVAAAVK